ncbi:MAG: MarR family transcriptional regulator [Planctomycetota bacterium]
MSSDGSATSILSAARRLYVSMARFDRVAAQALGVHVTDLHCVDLLEPGPLSAGELAAGLGLTRSAVTTVLDRLEAAGFVERRPSPDDRRRLDVALTASGRRRAGAVFRRLGHRIGARTAGQSERQRTRTVRAADDLAQACDEAAAELRNA